MSQVTFFTKHLFWAYLCWCQENTSKAHIVIAEKNVKEDYLKKYIRDGVLILNVSTTAVRDLNVEDTFVSFNAAFGGRPCDVVVTYDDILGFVSPIDGSLLPLNVIPILLDDGPGLVVVEKLPDPDKPIGISPNDIIPIKEPQHSQTNKNVVSLAEARKSADKKKT